MITANLRLCAVCIITFATCTFFPLPFALAGDEEREIRDLLTRMEKVFRARDVDAVMSCYAPGNDVLVFDIVPPLARVGNEAYRKNYEVFFGIFQGPLEIEFRDLKISAAAEVGFVTCLQRFGGVRKGGELSDFWFRVTSGLRKIDGKWLIVHEHVSVPINFDSGKALLDLQP